MTASLLCLILGFTAARHVPPVVVIPGVPSAGYPLSQQRSGPEPPPDTQRVPTLAPRYSSPADTASGAAPSFSSGVIEIQVEVEVAPSAPAQSKASPICRPKQFRRCR